MAATKMLTEVPLLSPPYQQTLTSNLCHAAKTGNLVEIARLLKAGALLDGTLSHDQTPLSMAAAYNYGSFLYFLNKGACLTNKILGSTIAEDIAIGSAISHAEKCEALELLAQRGVVLPPIHWAAFKGDRETLLAQIEQGNLLQRDSRGNNVIAYLCANGWLELLCELHQRVDAPSLTQANADGVTPLIHAAEHGRLPVIQWLLQNGAAVTDRNNSGVTALLSAAFNGHLETIQWLLKEGGAQVSEADNNGQSVLISAATGGKLDCVKWIIEYGDLRTERTTSGATALVVAALHGHSSTVRWLLLQGKATIDEKDQHGYTALFYAAANGHLNIVQWLLQSYGTARTKTGLSVLLYTAANGQMDCLQWLLKEGGAKITEVDNDGTTALLMAAAYGQLEIVQWLLKEGHASITETNKVGANALMLAASAAGDQLATVKWLSKECGASVGDKNSRGSNAVVYAANNGNLEIAKWLLQEGGSKLAEYDGRSSSALMCAAAEGHLTIVQWLIQQVGVKAAELNQSGYTALFYAIGHGRLETTQWLLREGGSKITEMSLDGTTPFLWAAGTDSLETVKWLLQEGGAKITETNANGDTAMLRAAFNGQVANVQWLLKQKASVAEKNKNGHTVLDLAAAGGFSYMLVSLITDLEVAQPDQFKSRSGIAVGNCLELCQDVELLQDVCIEYYVKQRFVLIRCVANEVLLETFPIVLRNIVSEYLLRDQSEQTNLFESILSKHTDPASRVRVRGTRSEWQGACALVRCLLADISAVSPTVAFLRATFKQYLASKTLMGSVKTSLKDILTEISLVEQPMSIDPSASPRNTTECKAADIADDETTAEEAGLGARLAKKIHSLSVQPKRLLHFVKGKSGE